MRMAAPILLCTLLLSACGEDAPPAGSGSGAAPRAAPLTSEQLAERFRAMVAAAKAQDVAAIQGLVTPMIPSRAELAGVLKAGPEADAWLRAYDGPTRETFKPDEAHKAGLGSATRTEIFVHQTTTEELVTYARGSVAFAEFPGGMKDFARSLAAPGRTWWCVEAREPGKESGTRFTAFTEIGGRFVLIVRPWRALPKADGEAGGGESGK